jgi:hypothetical protein
MIKAILIYLLLSILFGLTITTISRYTGQERLSLLKTVGFAMLFSVLALLTLFVIVTVF